MHPSGGQLRWQHSDLAYPRPYVLASVGANILPRGVYRTRVGSPSGRTCERSTEEPVSAAAMQRTVLFFESHSGYFYGAQQSLCLLVEHLDRSRFRPVVAGPVEGQLTQRLAAAGVRTMIIPLPEGLRD